MLDIRKIEGNDKIYPAGPEIEKPANAMEEIVEGQREGKGLFALEKKLSQKTSHIKNEENADNNSQPSGVAMPNEEIISQLPESASSPHDAIFDANNLDPWKTLNELIK